MNYRRITVSMLGAAIFALLTHPAQAQMENFYVRGGIGPTLTDKADFREFASEFVGDAEFDFDTGFNFDAAFGYQLTPWFALEAQTGFSYNSVDVRGVPSDGDLDVGRYPFLANVVFQLPNRTRFIPFAGAGIGGAASVLAADDFTIGATTADGTFSDFVFAYQFFGGLRYDFNDNMGIGIYYKYLTTESADWDPDLSIGTSGDIRASTLHSHSVNVAFTFRF
jgi:opacity protein-like surface antigen